MREVVIVSAVRTPIGSYQGGLSGFGANRLGAVGIAEAVRRAGISKDKVNEVIMGQVLSCGGGQNPAKQAAHLAGMPSAVECLTVNKVCGSGLKSVMLAAQAIQSGDADVVVAGGMESMSNAPHYLEKARFGYKMGPGVLEDHMIHDGLWDIVNDFHMGMSNEICSEKHDVSREEQDRYAAASYQKALAAIENGKFVDEIVPVPVPRKGGASIVIDRDECPRKTPYEKLAILPPVFKENGVGTAGNASSLGDGAAAVVVMARDTAAALGCPPLAVIGAQAAASDDMKYVLVAPPVKAIPKCLAKEGIDRKDIGLWEINEAFAGSTVAVLRALRLESAPVNVNGGSVALGHPLGCTGCRVLVTLLYEMMRRKKKAGLASLCLGGGEAVAMIVRRETT
jgi:acetyl-CoA C-acetyltransferase